jgi:hypothetical protein
MTSCPQCGAAQAANLPSGPRASQASGAAAAPALNQPKEENEADVELPLAKQASAEQTSIEATAEMSEPILPLRPASGSSVEIPLYPPPHAVFLAPEDERRRFPLITRQQLVFVAVVIALLLFLLTIGYLLWQQSKLDQQQLAARQAAPPQLLPAAMLTTPAPTPAVLDDNMIAQGVKAVLTAYGGQGVLKYQFEVKDGIVTLKGEADHEPEKEGAEKVLKELAGVKGVVNNLTVKFDPALMPVKLNEAEAKRLEEALLRDLRAIQPPPAANPKESSPKPAPVEKPSEEEQQRREQAAAKEREEEAAARKAAEERLQRQAAEFEHQQQEQQRLEAERRARAEQARIEATALRSGTVAWSGVVEGVDEIVISGSSASVRHISGQPPSQTRASFSAPVPRAPVGVKLLSTTGRGTISIVQEPSAANGYTTIVRIDDSGKGGNKRHEFTLRWSAQ